MTFIARRGLPAPACPWRCGLTLAPFPWNHSVMTSPGDLCTLILLGVLTLMVADGHSAMMTSPGLVTGLENPSPCAIYSSVLFPLPPVPVPFNHASPAPCEKLRLSTQSRSYLVYSGDHKRLLDKGNTSICVESKELLHLLTVSDLRNGTELLQRHKKDFRENPRPRVSPPWLGYLAATVAAQDADL